MAAEGREWGLRGAESAWDMLGEERRISTSSADLDRILGGGIACSQVTEIGGLPGIGKTQLGIQLAVNAQLPPHLGGLAGKALYIDTEGSFITDRALQIARASTSTTPPHLLDSIYYFRVCTYTQQMALINHLHNFISQHQDVKIVIVDSITFHFRQHFDDFALRTRLLSGMALKLMNLAKTHNVAIVTFNQVTTKYTQGSFQLALALGDSWSHSCTNRIILYWNGDQRFAYIDKSPYLRSASAPFSVTAKGIRDSLPSYKRTKLI